MKEKQYSVCVIVDPTFGDRIREIHGGEPIWIVDTPQNRLAYEAVRRERSPANHLTGLTSFKVDPDGKPEDWLIAALGTIELHHGAMSHDPAWSMINVIGVGWTERIGEELALLGFSKYQGGNREFTAIKKTANTNLEPISGS